MAATKCVSLSACVACMLVPGARLWGCSKMHATCMPRLRAVPRHPQARRPRPCQWPVMVAARGRGALLPAAGCQQAAAPGAPPLRYLQAPRLAQLLLVPPQRRPAPQLLSAWGGGSGRACQLWVRCAALLPPRLAHRRRAQGGRASRSGHWLTGVAGQVPRPPAGTEVLASCQHGVPSSALSWQRARTTGSVPSPARPGRRPRPGTF